MLYKTAESYRQLWQDSEDPKLVQLLHRQDEASLHPRVMQSSDSHSELVLVVEGEGTIFIDGRAYQVKGGDVVIYNEGLAHDQKMRPGERFVSYAVAVTGFKWPHCRPNCLIPDQLSPHLNHPKLASQLSTLFPLLCAQLETKGAGAERSVHYLLQSLLALFRETYQNTHCSEAGEILSDEIPLATRVRAYLDEHFCEDLTLQSLAERFNISTFYLSHIFKDQFGYPPLQYMLRRRIGLAQTLLITTDLPVGEIGLRVGYAYPSHFNLIFAKNVGISPRKYRLNYIN